VCPADRLAWSVYQDRATAGSVLWVLNGVICEAGASKHAHDHAFPSCRAALDLLDMLAPQFERELDHSQEQATFHALVRRAVQERLTGHRPTLENVARSLHMSARTLQRRLQQTGSSYQRILDEERHEIARYIWAIRFGVDEAIPPGFWRETHRTSAVL